MANQPKRKKKNPPPPSPESQAAEALTVAWALAVVTVAVCDIGAALTRLYAVQFPQSGKIGMLSGLLFFAAAVIGLIALAMLPLVYRLRTSPPPRGFVVFTVIVALAPVVVMIGQALR